MIQISVGITCLLFLQLCWLLGYIICVLVEIQFVILSGYKFLPLLLQ